MTPTPNPQPPTPYTRIIREPIDVRALEARVSGAANGAVCTFIGQVRSNYNFAVRVDELVASYRELCQ